MALHSLIEQIKAGCDSIDILDTVLKLREKRPKMVQTVEQYTFLYQALVTFIRRWMAGEVDSVVHSTVGSDIVLDAGIDNFGFEHVKL